MAVLESNLSILEEEEELVECYHYTSTKGKNGILKEKRINASKTGIMGKYVYLNSMDPDEYSAYEIAENNYGDRGE